MESMSRFQYTARDNLGGKGPARTSLELPRSLAGNTRPLGTAELDCPTKLQGHKHGLPTRAIVQQTW